MVNSFHAQWNHSEKKRKMQENIEDRLFKVAPVKGNSELESRCLGIGPFKPINATSKMLTTQEH